MGKYKDDYNEFLNKIKESVPDDKTRRLILPELRDFNYLREIRIGSVRILSLAFIVYYSLWKNDELRAKYFPQNALCNDFERIYTDTDIDFDYVIFILRQIQTYQQYNKDKEISKIINGKKSVYDWKAYIKRILIGRIGNDKTELNREVFFELLRDDLTLFANIQFTDDYKAFIMNQDKIIMEDLNFVKVANNEIYLLKSNDKEEYIDLLFNTADI